MRGRGLLGDRIAEADDMEYLKHTLVVRDLTLLR